MAITPAGPRLPETIAERFSKSLEETPGRALNAYGNVKIKIFGFSVGSNSIGQTFLQPVGGFPTPYGQQALSALNQHYGTNYPIIFESFLGNPGITSAGELAQCQAATGNGYSKNFTFGDGSAYPNMIFTPYQLLRIARAKWVIQRGKGCLIQVARNANIYTYPGGGVVGARIFAPGTPDLPFYDLPVQTPQIVNGFVVNPPWQNHNDGVDRDPGNSPILGLQASFGTNFALGGIIYEAGAINLPLPEGFRIAYPNVGPIYDIPSGSQPLFGPNSIFNGPPNAGFGPTGYAFWSTIGAGAYIEAPATNALRTVVPVLFLGQQYLNGATPGGVGKINYFGATSVPHVVQPSDPEAMQYDPSKYGLFTIA